MAAGRPAPPVATSSRDEVGRLARAFTDMSAQLAAADAQRRALLADVAHELRTPVAALRAELENLVDGVRPADRTALQETLAQAERLGTLVEDLLDLARAEGTVGLVDPTPVDLGPLATDVAREVAGAHGAPPVVVFVEQGLVVWADEARLRQVLTNLLDNAVRHGSRDGRVAVVAQASADGGAVVEVQDDGPGIPADERSRVFERFRSGTGSTAARATGGTGLGLAIARWAVQLHGGRIGVVDQGPGCTVRVELPARPEGRGREHRRARTAAAPAPRPRRAARRRGAAPDPGPAPGPAPDPGPPRPPWWPAPVGRVPWPLAVTALGSGALAAATLPGARAGLPLTLLLLAGVAVVVLRRRGRRTDGDLALLLPAAGLALVPALRAETLLVVLASTTTLGLLAVLAFERTRWPGLLLAPVLLPVAAARGAAWLVARPPVHLGRPRQARAWLAGAAAAVVVVLVLVALLASADAAFARLVQVPLPAWAGWRGVLGLLVAALALGLGTAAAPPRPERGLLGRAGSPAEWALPLLGADAVLAAFLTVQGAVLLDPEAALAGTGVTPAAWAREGFGQLVAVTLLVLLTLGWAVRRSDPAVAMQRHLLRGGGGVLALLTLGVVASALSRMWLYADRFGGTTLRLYVVVFELWLAVVVVLVVLMWLRGRPGGLPRAVLATAAWVLLGLAAAGPDAVVARYDVERFQRTGSIDTAYLASLSADAVPALLRLPQPERAEVLGDRRPHEDPWYASTCRGCGRTGCCRGSQPATGAAGRGWRSPGCPAAASRERSVRHDSATHAATSGQDSRTRARLSATTAPDSHSTPNTEGPQHVRADPPPRRPGVGTPQDGVRAPPAALAQRRPDHHAQQRPADPHRHGPHQGGDHVAEQLDEEEVLGLAGRGGDQRAEEDTGQPEQRRAGLTAARQAPGGHEHREADGAGDGRVQLAAAQQPAQREAGSGEARVQGTLTAAEQLGAARARATRPAAARPASSQRWSCWVIGASGAGHERWRRSGPRVGLGRPVGPRRTWSP
jgi:nitrogen-specific signal transduction histidine kinase